MPQRLGITLLFCFTLISLLALHANATLHAELRHKRLFKKRMPQVLPFSQPSTGTNAPTPTQVSSSTPATTITTPTEGVPTATTASQASSDSSSSTSNTASTSGSSSSASSSSASASSHISSTPTPTVASTPPNLGNAGAGAPPPGLQTQTETISSTSPSSSSSSTAQTQSDVSRSQQKVTLTVIVVIASSVGGIAILWTVFRKWKLGRSSRFDERLQPIDWEPPSEDKRRGRPVSNASSFHSGGGGHNSGSEHGHQGNVAPLPEHDFTALPSSRFGGYADLARGPSPQPPQMLETYNHSPVAGYDVNVPLHHQAGYGGADYTNYNNAQMRY